jgi:hypothetical protein
VVHQPAHQVLPLLEVLPVQPVQPDPDSFQVHP